MDMEKLAAAMAPVIRSLVDRATAPLADQIRRLEARPLPEAIKGDPGPEGQPGKDAEPVALEDVAAALLAADELRTLVDLHVAEAVSDHLDRNPPEPGAKGEPGKDGQDGVSVSLEDVERMVHARMAQWELDFERRAQGVLERAVERMPKPADGKDGRDGVDGKDGADGFGLDDLVIEDDGERSIKLRFVRGNVVREHEVRFPHVVDRGVYRHGDDYQRGDGVTFGGSWWIAQKDAPEDKPGLGDGWRLAVKRGRNGKDGKDGERGPEGKAAPARVGGPF